LSIFRGEIIPLTDGRKVQYLCRLNSKGSKILKVLLDEGRGGVAAVSIAQTNLPPGRTFGKAYEETQIHR